MRVFLFLLFGIISSGARAAATYQCLSCPPGSYSDSGATGCKPCPANHYCPGATTKFACPAWATAAAGSIFASDCIAPPSGPATGLGGQYCASMNKNECTANAGGNNNCATSSYTAWDGSSAGSTPYKAQQNGYGIQASTWACKDSNSVAPNAASDAQCRSGSSCWCAYSKSPDTSASTFSSGAWSSWVVRSVFGSAAYCAGGCAVNCANSASNSSLGGAVKW
jgi:hypothetical protein